MFVRLGIESITVTLDNASSNNVSIQYVINTVNQWGGAILRGEHMHLRCASHILNLIVQDGLKEYDESISKIRDVVRYVKSSTARMQKLKECAEQAKITCKKSVSLDVPTRWNSTYLMLEAAEKYQKAFERMEMHDVGYVKEFCTSEEKACPNESDWDSARLFIKFLKIFYDSTLRFSGSNYVTSNHFLDRVSFIHSRLAFWCGNKNNYKLNIMAESMKIKFDKYWGEIEKLNPLLLVAVLLDPRYKEPYLKVCFEMMCSDSLEASRHANNVRKILDQMYKEYYIIDSNGDMHHSSSTHLGEESRDEDEDDDDYTWFDQQRKEKLKAAEHSENKTEVDKYFIEACENFENPDFDVLKWWKHNAGRFKILSKIAQDIFAIPVSTVASESAFSTGGRVIDPYRSCLTPKAVQALICTQNWIRNTIAIDITTTIEEVEALENEILAGIGDIRIE
uniref:Zinc finger BED domain-containing protein RICESLEEPER 2-like n=1 Tax=Cannabis sativa TaxID=3483 RepID=A0A803PST2_CANSA